MLFRAGVFLFHALEGPNAHGFPVTLRPKMVAAGSSCCRGRDRLFLEDTTAALNADLQVLIKWPGLSFGTTLERASVTTRFI